MNVHLATLGCRLNEAELQSWARGFRAAGHGVVPSPEAADVVVLNSCAVTAEAARKSRKLSQRLHRTNPLAKVVLTGCYASLEPGRAAALDGVDLVVANADKPRLVDLITETLSPFAMPTAAQAPDSAHVFESARTRAFVKVQDGCKNRCTFCIVTVARGAERSRAIADVTAEIRALCEGGAVEVVLAGVHLGGYGRDRGTSLRDLVRAILDETPAPRLRLGSLEPWDLPPGFFDLWRDPRLGAHLHLPLQSGSDTVLRRMARRCTKATYRQLVDDARDAIADLTLTTDLIVGFPGETVGEHGDSLAFVESIGFGHVHIFAYSPRAGTTAARLPGQLPRAVKRDRSAEVHALAATMKAAHVERFVGQTRPVLWEGGAQATGDGRHRFWGYTDNYLRVTTVVAPGRALSGLVTPTRLDHVVDGAHLVGTTP